MISVSRFPFRVPEHLLNSDSATWRNDLCEARATFYSEHAKFHRGERLDRPKRPRANSSHYAHPSVRQILMAIFGPKCCYCEANVKAVSDQHVEHFRPASRYPALAYEWDNLLLACTKCNRDFKSDRFPLLPGGHTVAELRRKPCSRTAEGERPYLVNPCFDTPEHHITFKDARVVSTTDRGLLTRRTCGLNRPDLLEERRSWLAMVRATAKAYEAAQNVGRTDDADYYGGVLRRCTQSKSTFAGMVRAELTSMGINWQTL